MSIKGIVFHWSAGRYNQTFKDYHYNITYDPKTKKASIIKTCDSDEELKAHTAYRNTGRIGISLSCAYNATTENLGSYPPTDQQIELACSLAGKLIKKYGIKPEDDEINTHADWAIVDNYGPGQTCERWDLWVPNWKGTGKNLSRLMRDKSWWYYNQLVKPSETTVENYKYQSLIEKYAKKYNFPPLFIKAVIEQESSFNPQAVSSSNAKGLMQLLPGTFEDCRKTLGLSNDIFNPEINIACGCYYFSWIRDFLKSKEQAEEKLLLCAYNQGPSQAGLKYAKEVLKKMK